MRNSPLVNWLSRRDIKREDAVLSSAEASDGANRALVSEVGRQRDIKVAAVRAKILELMDAWDEFPEE